MNPSLDCDNSPRRRTSLVLVALAALVALIATLLAPASAQAATRSTGHTTKRTVSAPVRLPSENSYATALLSLMNTERAGYHLAPLTSRNELLVSSRRHNLAMAHADSMSHQLPGETDLGKRITAAGFPWHYVGENIGWNSDISVTGVLALQKMMFNEVPPENGHRLNILNRNYKNVGVDVYVDNTHHKVWLTVDFGTN